MAWMTGGRALVESLVKHGVDTVFALPGIHLYGALAALREEPRIRYVGVRHEQATAYMADGYARASGRPGIAMVTPGPGLLNAAAGLSTAYSASSPVLMISGQILSTAIGKGLGLGHEVDDQQDAVAPVTKWRERVLEIERIPDAVTESFRQMTTGRPRPVEIEIPYDLLEDEARVDLQEPYAVKARCAADDDVAQAAKVLLGAESPVIYAGGGAVLSEAADALREVAEFLQAGVVTSPEGKGSVDERLDIALGAGVWSRAPSPVLEFLDSADVVLVVGSRLVSAGLLPSQRVVQIDIDEGEIGRQHPVTVGLVGDAATTLRALLEHLRVEAESRSSRRDEFHAVRCRVDDHFVEQPQRSFLDALRAACPEDTILVPDITQIGTYSRLAWPTYGPRSYLTPSYSGNLGYAYPTALGAKIARPERPVVVVSGDGGFLFNVQEMATAVGEEIAVVAVVFNDGGFGNVARDLDDYFGGAFASELHNPDYLRLAEAFGMDARRARGPEELRRAVAEAIESDTPVLIEAPVDGMPRPKTSPTLRTPIRREEGRPPGSDVQRLL